MFGPDWQDPTKVDEKAQQQAAGGHGELHLKQLKRDEEKKVARKEAVRTCCKFFIPGITVIAILGFFIGVIATSGSGSTQGTPKAAVIILEGFKGTVFEQLLAMNRLPNMQYLALKGTRSICASTSDSRCCRTQSGALSGPQYMWTSGPGIASILTGVDVTKHQVANDSFTAYSVFTSTAPTYPTLLSTAKKNGLTTQVIGAGHLTTSIAFKGGACSLFGIADFECGTDAAGRCLQASTCNMDQRVITIPNNDFAGTEEVTLDSLIAQNTPSADVVLLHANKLARLAEDPAFPNFFYDAASAEYAAEAFVLDSVVGQFLTYLNARVTSLKENWLVVLTSDHGGLGKSSGTNTDDDEVVPFIVATMTTNGNLQLRSLQTPNTQMDVVPTILSWFGLTIPTYVDGVVQGICSTGIYPADCLVVT